MSYELSSRYTHCVFTYWLVSVVLAGSLERIIGANDAVVKREDRGDKFTNPFYKDGVRNCAGTNAHCVSGLLLECSECECNKGTETYRADLKRCISTEQVNNFTGCRYQGIKDLFPHVYMNKNVPTLDFTRSKSKNFRGLLEISSDVDIKLIKCQIENTTSYLDIGGNWIELSNITDILHIGPYDSHVDGTINRYLTLQWEGVKRRYSGLIVKLDVSCRTHIDVEYGCFAFKTQGTRRFASSITSTIGTIGSLNTGRILTVRSPKITKKIPTIRSTQGITTTMESSVNDNDTFSVSMPVIIGVSVGVGLVILIIIVFAVCFVRYRTRKSPETKLPTVNTDAPKVQFTAQARFSLIQEVVPIEPTYNDYASLQEKRESYLPYCSLKKDDVDMNVIDNILKNAISMESMGENTEPRYSCRLTKDDAIIIESSKSLSPKQPKYHVLEGPDDEADYEEVDTSDDEDMATSSRLLSTKPPLPVREYHVLERPSRKLQSDC